MAGQDSHAGTPKAPNTPNTARYWRSNELAGLKMTELHWPPHDPEAIYTIVALEARQTAIAIGHQHLAARLLLSPSRP